MWCVTIGIGCGLTQAYPVDVELKRSELAHATSIRSVGLLRAGSPDMSERAALAGPGGGGS